MRLFYAFVMGLMLTVSHSSAYAASRYSFEPGDQVLTNCNEIYTKGSVKAKVDDGYTIHFPKGSGPINCPPYRWHWEFVQPFQSVSEYKLQFFAGLKKDLLFRVGETVTLHFDADKRVVKNQARVAIEAQITDISSNGAIAVKLLSTSPEASVTFTQWVGNNYIDLRHKALDEERAKRSN